MAFDCACKLLLCVAFSHEVCACATPPSAEGSLFFDSVHGLDSDDDEEEDEDEDDSDPDSDGSGQHHEAGAMSAEAQAHAHTTAHHGQGHQPAADVSSNNA